MKPMTAMTSSVMSDKHFIVIDGIDGAGKSTLQTAALAWFEARQLAVFDVTSWSKQHGRLPQLAEIPSDTCVLFTAEPTHVGIGRAIRDIVIQAGSSYSSRETAAAFALDRDALYRQLLIPFLAKTGQRWIIQDRGLISSLAYQPLQSQRKRDAQPLTETEILALPGNQTALEHCPQAFVFVDIDPAIAQQRLAGRTDKQDNDIFDDAGFQTALAGRYTSTKVIGPLTERGLQLHIINGGAAREDVAAAMRQVLDHII